jgi:hypothetical protein
MRFSCKLDTLGSASYVEPLTPTLSIIAPYAAMLLPQRRRIDSLYLSNLT